MILTNNGNRTRPLRSFRGGDNIVGVQRGPQALESKRTMNDVYRCARPPFRFPSATTVTDNNAVAEDDATFATPAWGNWNIESLTFHSNPTEHEKPIVNGVRGIQQLLTSIQQIFAPLGIQVQEYCNDPVGAVIQTREENIVFHLTIYRQGSFGRYTYGISMHELRVIASGDPVDISRYRFQIRQAALGNRIMERRSSRSLLSTADQIRVLEEALDNSEERGNEQYNINSDQDGLAIIRREFDRFQGIGRRLELVPAHVHRRESLRIPDQTADAWRQVEVRVVDATAAVYRRETVFLLTGRNAFRLVGFPGQAMLRHQESIPSLGGQGMISFCERLTRQPTGRHIYQVDAQQRFATIIEVDIEEFEVDALIALMTSRFLECVQILQDQQGRVYFVCHNTSCSRNRLDQANVTLPPPRLRPVGYQVNTQYIRTWFRDMVLAVDATFQGGFDLVNLDPSGTSRYEMIPRRPFRGPYKHHHEVIRALGQMLFECLTGVSFPSTSDQFIYPFFLQFWVSRGQLDHLEVPNRVMEILQVNYTDWIGSNGPLGNLLELVHAVHSIPPVARDLLIQLLNQRLSLSDILRHPFLS